MAKIKVLNQDVTAVKYNDEDYISLTDIANSKDGEQRAADIIKNWIRNRGTLEFIGTWEQLYNPNFKVVEFNHFKMSSGLPSFVLSPGKWIKKTASIGMTAKEWREKNTNLKGNMRDYSNVEQLVVLANMESMNAELIKNDISQKERLRILNTMAISQLKSISNINSLKQLEDK